MKLNREDKELIYNIIDAFLQDLAQKHINVSKELRAISIQKLLRHLNQHIRKYGIYSNNNPSTYEPEAYKILSWYAFILAGLKKGNANYFGEQQRATIIATAIAHLNRYLEADLVVGFDISFLKKLTAMAITHYVDDDLSIGKNGVYMAFKAVYMFYQNFEKHKDGEV